MTATSTINPDVSFDNRYTRELPADPVAENYRRQVRGACYSRVLPTPVSNPRLVAWSREVAEELGFDAAYCGAEEFLQVFAGNRLLPGMDPHAMCYGGHQFGNWAGQLGDGRAINLGELVTPGKTRRVLQLKGAGPTPYSRTADGLAVLRSSIREFLCSEAMHHLGVPTTRALSVVTTGEMVLRDMFYDGNPRLEPGAIVCRVAPSFVRFGNFELPASRGDTAVLQQLVDYCIRNDFPELGAPAPQTTLDFLEAVCRSTATLMAHWMRVGFVHGVMNTDNMSILGLTIDYGPYGWLDNYDPDWTPNTTDAGSRRYRYDQQPQIAHWNLYQLASALYPLIDAVEPLQERLAIFPAVYQQQWQRMLLDKLGLENYAADTDASLLADLLALLPAVETDMTLFFRLLSELPLPAAESPRTDTELLAPLREAYYRPEQLDPDYQARLADWLRRYQQRLRRDGVPEAQRQARMQRANPRYVLRNYLAQQAIDQAEQGDYSLVNELLELLRRPYDAQPDQAQYAAKRPDWARQRAGCSMLSCSS